MVDPARVAEVLGIQASDIRELARKVEQGLPKQALVRVAARLAVQKGDVAKLRRAVVPDATFKRRSQLNPQESERTERMARTIAHAECVWNDREAAREWLHLPHALLDGKTPSQAALTGLGARRVEDILQRLFHGIPA
jgi:putative toxin-antitoxin system antitoxin component (TIGR02293 family)